MGGGSKAEVRLSFSARGRKGKPRRASPRATAVLGILAILFQAILGTWHHHELRFSSHVAIAVVSAPASEEAPEAAHQHCQICFALGHVAAVPVDWLAAALPDPDPLPPNPAADVAGPFSAYFLFRARAPPPA